MMTEEEQRIAIAEKCGWVFVNCAPLVTIGFWYFKPSPQDLELAKKGRLKVIFRRGSLPDYPNDLNAMHEAWLTLDSKELRGKFHYELQKVVVRGGGHATSSIIDADSCVENAPAEQRSEAYCRVFWPERFTKE